VLVAVVARAALDPLPECDPLEPERAVGDPLAGGVFTEVCAPRSGCAGCAGCCAA
jgi:hypothetical protein